MKPPLPHCKCCWFGVGEIPGEGEEEGEQKEEEVNGNFRQKRHHQHCFWHILSRRRRMVWGRMAFLPSCDAKCGTGCFWELIGHGQSSGIT
ncbi:hypothetical protein CNJ03175 [Cryptococcus deneoformans JEC21]|uniref:Uncharacterized protein n=1 Tax=Cryptococcus deneoformans (strain JEC21 / ATCC MYA-565) TaxID=214684 RepID=A0A0S2LJ94_CRYD1|nr:hypothetical protein CNJ03175 [Cryptococcus neoformans var. neoformans JEC21]ALO60932.1 hypothetical protein CNJ03175 [Cryptococcus neoformans var. neoformans JEC21]